MKSFQNKIVLITGGASGIGKIMARLMLERKAKVIIWDISQVNIDATLNEFLNYKDVYSYRLDIADVQQLQETAHKVKQEVGVVDVIINNAGIIVGK